MDSNVVAQEKGLEALTSLVKESGETSAKSVRLPLLSLASPSVEELTHWSRLRPDVMPAVVDKCFGSARASMKTKAIELALLWVEVEGTAEGVVVSLFVFLISRARSDWARSYRTTS